MNENAATRRDDRLSRAIFLLPTRDVPASSELVNNPKADVVARLGVLCPGIAQADDQPEGIARRATPYSEDSRVCVGSSAGASSPITSGCGASTAAAAAASASSSCAAVRDASTAATV